jgi:hypothetical protein
MDMPKDRPSSTNLSLISLSALENSNSKEIHFKENASIPKLRFQLHKSFDRYIYWCPRAHRGNLTLAVIDIAIKPHPQGATLPVNHDSEVNPLVMTL